MIEKVIIMGAAGRDFHNFNVYFRDNPRYRVVAFTAAQIPTIEGRVYPAELSGTFYPKGIPIYPEKQLAELIRDQKVDLVAFSYSDVPHVEVMHKASIAMAEGADFILIGATYTMLRSKKPVIAVCAVRTGSGKSQTTRKVCEILCRLNRKVVVVRHPMPYGDLKAQIVQRFSTYEDFEKHHCTLEEREEYEPLVDLGIVVYAGVDYGRILKAAEEEAEFIVWDGETTIPPFIFPMCTWSFLTLTGPAMSPSITRGRPTCSWPTSPSSTKWIRPLLPMWNRSGKRSETGSPRPKLYWPSLRS